jgi:hypothetical protein
LVDKAFSSAAEIARRAGTDPFRPQERPRCTPAPPAYFCGSRLQGENAAESAPPARGTPVDAGTEQGLAGAVESPKEAAMADSKHRDTAKPMDEPRKKHGDKLHVDPTESGPADGERTDGEMTQPEGGVRQKQAKAAGRDELGFPPDDESQWG